MPLCANGREEGAGTPPRFRCLQGTLWSGSTPRVPYRQWRHRMAAPPPSWPPPGTDPPPRSPVGAPTNTVNSCDVARAPMHPFTTCCVCKVTEHPKPVPSRLVDVPEPISNLEACILTDTCMHALRRKPCPHIVLVQGAASPAHHAVPGRRRCTPLDHRCSPVSIALRLSAAHQPLPVARLTPRFCRGRLRRRELAEPNCGARDRCPRKRPCVGSTSYCKLGRQG